MLASVIVLSAFFKTHFGNPGRVERKRQAVDPFAHDNLLWKPTGVCKPAGLCKPTLYFHMETKIGYVIFSSTTSEVEKHEELNRW